MNKKKHNNKTIKVVEHELNDKIKSLIITQLGFKYGNRHINAGHIKYHCSKYIGMILNWDEAIELAEEYNKAA